MFVCVFVHSCLDVFLDVCGCDMDTHACQKSDLKACLFCFIISKHHTFVIHLRFLENY